MENIAIKDAVTGYNNACKTKFVPSPSHTCGYNKQFKNGCTEEQHQVLFQEENPTFVNKVKLSTDRLRKIHRESVKKMKAECFNKGKLITLIKVSC